MMKRLSIYVIKESDIHSYMLEMLHALKAVSDKLIVIYAVDVRLEHKEEVFGLSSRVIRADTLSVLHAWKTALSLFSWDELSVFDEAVYLDSDVVGPVGSLELMLNSMRDFDFWAFAQEYADEDGQTGLDRCCVCGFGKCALAQKLRVFMRQKTEFHREEDARIASELNEAGFKCGYFLNTSAEAQYTARPLLNFAAHYLRTRNCPVFLREAFTRDYREMTACTVGQPPLELYQELTRRGCNFDSMMDYLLKTRPQAEIVKILHLNFTLSTDACDKNKLSQILQKRRVALVMHLYYMDLLDDSLRYASAMPACADVYITTNSIEKQKEIREKFASLPVHKLDVRVIPNRGRDVSSILVGVRDVINDYDYVCFVHDKKTMQSKPAIIGSSFAYLLFENLLASPAYVSNILSLMEDHPRMGILSPPLPFLDGYFPILGYEWGQNFELCMKTARELGVTLPLQCDQEPVAPMGTCFWFRPKAFRLFYDRGWRYEDFPPEPNRIDGTLLHAIERLYPIIPQQLGYFPATVMTENYTRMELDNLRDSVRDYNRIIIEAGCISNREYMQYAVRDAFAQRQKVLSQKKKWKLRLR